MAVETLNSPQRTTADPPSEELTPARPPDHDPRTGRFLPGNEAGLVHGARRRLDRPEALANLTGKRNGRTLAASCQSFNATS
jgi:hypothetical protein